MLYSVKRFTSLATIIFLFYIQIITARPIDTSLNQLSFVPLYGGFHEPSRYVYSTDNEIKPTMNASDAPPQQTVIVARADAFGMLTNMLVGNCGLKDTDEPHTWLTKVLGCLLVIVIVCILIAAITVANFLLDRILPRRTYFSGTFTDQDERTPILKNQDDVFRDRPGSSHKPRHETNIQGLFSVRPTTASEKIPNGADSKL